MGGRQADADECYQFAEMGAVQDKEGNGWVCQNAWESFWITANCRKFPSLEKLFAAYCTWTQWISLQKKILPSPSPAVSQSPFVLQRQLQSRECYSLHLTLRLTVKIPHSCILMLPVPCVWNLHALFRALLLQETRSPGRDWVVC